MRVNAESTEVHPGWIAALSVSAALAGSLVHERRMISIVVPLLLLQGVLAARARPLPVVGALALGAGLRAAWLGGAPWFSDDLFRYVYEGDLLRHGLDPFRVPAAHTVGFDASSQVNHPGMTSIYPWGAQALFAVAGSAGPDGWRVAAILADLATIGLVGSLAGARAATWWALHPLAVVESGSSAHLEPFALPITLLALRWQRDRPATALGALALATSVKLFPITLAWAWGRSWFIAVQRTVCVMAVVIAGSAAISAPGPAWFASLGTYSAHWAFNSATLGLGSWLLGESWRPLAILAGLGVVLTAPPRPLVAWSRVGLAFLLLTPTAHPWYALWWLAPGVLAGERRVSDASTAMLSAYLVLVTWDSAGGTWREPWWLWPVTWGPFAFALLRPSRPITANEPASNQQNHAE
jgi:alpha-1,6-mannosyltransferase